MGCNFSDSARLPPSRVAQPSHGQRSLWFLHHLAPEAGAYNIAAAARVRSPVDAGRLERAFQALVDRHGALRTTFPADAGEPCRRVAQHLSFTLGREDAAGWSDERLRSRLADEAWRPFDLENGPLLRVTLFTGAPGGPVLLVVIHHVIADFWSLALLMREIPALYREEDLASPGLSYDEHVRLEREALSDGRGEAVLAWWRERLAGLPTLELATDRPRPAVQTYKGDTHRLRLPGELAAALRARSRAQHGTLFMTLAAAFQALLGRLSGQEDLAIGTARSGRTHAQVAGTVGYFVNQVVLRGDLSGDPAFVELLERTKAAVQEAFAHGDYPLPLLAEHLQPERDASRTPLFQISLVLQKETRGVEGLTAFALGEEGVTVGPQDFRLESMSLPQPPSPFDLVLHCVERQGTLSLALQYNTDLFDATTTAFLLERFERLLEGVAADPRQRLSELPLLSAAEREQLLVEWNDTAAATEQPGPLLVHELVAEQARQRPAALAVATPEARITYGELASRARQLAATLGRLGVRPEVRVALCAGQAVERVVGSLAVLGAGGAYVLLDPESPPERLAFLVADAKAEVVLTERALAGRFESCGARLVDIAESRGEDNSLPFPAVFVRPDNLAYVVYTSGSTGLPKGVAVSHAGLLNLVRWHRAAYGIGPDDRATLIANPAFDASVWELWPYLAAGASLHVPGPETRLAPREIVRFWRSEGITWSFLPTPLAEEVLALPDERGLDGLSLQGLLCGGDRLHHVPRRDLPFSLLNHYGPSEVSVVSTSAAVHPGTPGLPPIGRPIHNLRIRIVDAWGALAARGAVGELWIGGVGLARGYLDRPALTAERFVPDPWSGAAGERLYRSGDRVRLRPDGNLEFLGRIDHQIKLRGFRIEPGEIEAALRAHPAVAEAAVVLHQGRLAAYVAGAPGEAPSGRELREHLRERLPAYMVPAAFVALPALPLTPNGKLDRKALPEPLWEGSEAAGSQAPPRTPAEELMAGIFAEVLGVERIGVEESFFEHGGHSLAALRLNARIREAFGVELPLHRVFETPTVAALAAAVADASRSGAPLLPPLVPVPRDQPLPLSFAQQRLWFLHQLEPASPAYNIPAAIHLRGPLDGAVLAASLGELARRHETLRTRFVAEPGGPVQAIDPPAPVPLPEIDLAGLSADEALRLARAEALRPFDLMRGPVWRSTLARLGPEEHLLLLTLHHIAGDGWSLRVLARELGEIYGAFSQGRPSPLPELAIQYGDYAVWQRGWLQGGALEAELAHWRERLAGAPPVLDLPLDRPRPAVPGDRGGSRALALPAALMPSLQALARRQGVTLFMAVLAAFQALLARVSTSEDVSVGTPIAGRGQIRTEGLIGFFVNTLVLRTDLSGEPPFTELLARVREVALAAYAHQDLPFDKLVEELHPRRDLGIAPLVQVSFTLDGEPLPSLRLGEAAGDAWRLEQETEKLDLSLTLGMEAEGLSGGLSGGMGFRSDLFDGATIERLAGSFVRLLAGAVEEPRRRLSELPLLSPEERAQLLVEWNDTATAPRSAPLVHELVVAWARRRPEGLAVAAPGERLGYGELVARAGRLARSLVRLGVGPEVRVTLCAGPTVHRVVGSLAVLLAGGAYVPVDPEAPPERLAFLVADSGSQVVLTERALAGLFAACAARLVALDEVDEDGEEASSVPARAVGRDNLAYVVYTSGSTGRPKGVAVSHAGLLNLVRWHAARYGVGPDDRATLIANPAFDAAVWEIWPYLAAGASLHIPDAETRLAPAAIVRFWRQQGITWSFLPTPLAEEMIAEPAAASGLALRGLLCGGDRLHRAPPPGLGFHLINHYGPSEVSVVSTSVAVLPETAGVPSIGRPIDNLRTFVADARGGLAPRGSAGELWIGGAGLARGYLDRPALTAERFVPDPWSGAAGERLYRTGDLVRHRPDGTLDFLGRIDHQIKLRGFRIEPGEIEALLRAHPAVSDAAVAVFAPARLVAYVVGRDGLAPSAAELREHLRERLPGYMVPAACVALPALPLTPSGKLDRKALPDPGTEERNGALPPRTPAEELVARIFAEVLNLERVGRDENFFELGGHSLLATRVSSRMRAVCGLELPVRMVFEAPTVERLAAWIERSTGGAAGARIARVSREEPLVLSFAQQRLWFLDQLEPGSIVYNIPAAVELTGRLDAGAMTAAFAEVVRRHEVLRTTFREVAGEPVQVVAEPAGFALPLIDLASLPAPGREREAGRLAAAEARRPFDLETGPLLRAALLRSAAGRHMLVLTMHHIVSDGWSMGVLVRELGALYAAQVDLEPAAGRPSPLPELAIQYADFAAWQRRHLAREAMETELAWWLGQLANIPPALEMPADHPRPAVSSLRGAVHHLTVAAEDLAGLTRLSRQHDATLFMTLLAGFAALLHRASGQEDVVVGTPIAGRTRIETEPLIGFFVNTLALRADLSGAPGFLALLARVRETTLAAYAHQELPFERLVEELAPERDRSRTPIFQAMLAFQNNAPEALALPGIAAEVRALTTGTAKFDLNLVLSETAQGGLTGLIEFSLDLFDGTTVARLAGHFARLLAAAAADPLQPVRELPLLADGERHQLLAEWNDTRAPFPETTLLHQFFEAAVERAPEAIAAACAGRELTYAELDARSNRLAHLLRNVGVDRGAPVGVWVERSLDMLTAVLGVLKAGGHYVALDEAWPADRVELILAATGAPAIVAGAGLLGAVEEMRWRLPALSDVVCLAFGEPEPPAEEIDPESVRALWDFVAERAVDKVVDRILAGGFVSAFTGEPMSEAEVDEYRDRVTSLAGPWLQPDARVLEIGNGSGLLLWEMASRVAHVTGVDPSPLTQERNQQHAAQEGIANVELLTGFAHEVEGLLGAEERFDLILLASTVQFFPGPRYLERMVRQALGRLSPGGALLVADVLDARRREELRQVTDERRRARGLEPAAPRRELFLDEDLFRDLGGAVHHRTEGFPNELGFRYDVLLTGEPAERRKRVWTGWHVDRCLSARLPQVAEPEDVAYVIHTSGSTGEPKGIVVQHRPAANLVDWINRTFEVGSGDRGLFVTSLCFDLSVYDVFGLLAAGGTVHVATRDELADPDHLVRLLRTGGITLWDSAPAALLQLAPLFPAEPDAGSRLRRVLLSGDWIPVTLPDRVRQSFPGAAVMALGGATEATVWSNWFPVGVVDPAWPSIPYGRPMANARYHVLDEGLAPCPIGVPGDLYIGGDCLCAGYARRPELTAQAFLPDPFSILPGARLYRTGDRARAFADGNLEFLGRLDQQVKVRGYRIELGEIEVALARHPQVREAVALAREDEPGDKRLVAYVVLDSTDRTDPSDLSDLSDPKFALAAWLRARLPEYMIPSAFVMLPELPVTANGKLDRRALPAPEYSAGAGFVAARTPTEEALAAIWSSILSVPQVGREDGFFDLGGHSLLATQMLSRVREAFGVELSLRTLFDKPRLADLAEAVDAARAGSTVPRLQPMARVELVAGQGLPLSFPQQRLWFLEQLEPGSPAYNIPLAIRLDGRLDRAALAAAFGEVVRRHEVLRTTIRDAGGMPVVDLTPNPSCLLPLIDLQGFEAEAERVAFEEARRPFDLGAGPLLRVLLLRLGAERHMALVTMHHIVSDGWSIGVLVRELGTLYESFAAGRPSPLPELPIQYAEFAAWQRRHLSGELLEAELAWWRERLAGMPQVLDLPTDHPRPAKRGLRGAAHSFTIDGEGLAGLAELSRRHGATLFMTLLAGFAALLHRATGADDLAVGTPIAGRTRAETEALIGLFVNTLVLRTGLAGDPAISAILDQVRETTLSAYAHQEVPFERLVEDLAPERDLGRPPLVQVLLVLHNAPSAPLELPGLALTVAPLETGTAKLDLACAFIETEQGLAGTFEYSPDLFEAATIERWAGHLTRLLAGAVADPHQRLSELPMLSAEERRQLLVEWNGGGTETFTDSTLHGLFETQAARTPEAVALVDGRTGERWTYRELDEWAGSLARELVDLGVGPEIRVAVQLPRTPHLVASLLAVLKAGGAYVPLDPTYPEDRLAFLLEDSDAAVLITTQGPEAAGRRARTERNCLSASEFMSTARSATPPASHPGNLAYLIYTSGSTGRPKAVAIEHRSAVAFACWARTVFTPADFAGVLAATSISFDLSVFELFVTLAWGGKVILAANALELPHLLAAGEVTLINTVPSAMTELVRQRAVPPSVRTVNLAGEPLKRSLVDAIYATTAATRVLDLYGPSESTTYSTWAPALRGERREPTIGQPVAGTRAFLLGHHGELVPVGIAGEIFLGGAGLARGYLNRPDLTAERFVPDPFALEAGSRLYRTGDLARRLPDGRLDYLGRLDQQVKIRGFRIEPGEIEAALTGVPGVREAAVLAREDLPGGAGLVAYVILNPTDRTDPTDLPDLKSALAAGLRERLPEHMIPGAFVILPALPLTPNGKLDRRALPAPDRTSDAAYEPPRTPAETALAAIWSDMLRVPQVGREDSFFDLGGHSLLATQMLSRVQEACGVALPLRAAFEAPRLADLARAVDAAQAGSSPRKLRPLARRQESDQHALPLSFAQQRLWLLQQLEPGSATYNMPVAVELSGRLDVGAMAAALAEVVRRHESLRTTFTVVDGAPLQVISPLGRVDLPLVDLAALPAPAADAEAERLGREQAGQGFDLERGPLVAGLLARLPGERHHFLLTLHHVISDGWSIGVLIHELGALYAAFVEGRPSPLPAPPIQYADFAVWQREELAEKQAAELAYWETRLGGEVATIELPTDRPRPAIQTFHGGRRQLALSPELTARLNSFGRGEGSTLFMTLLAATQALLSRHSGEQDVPVGAPVAGRRHSATEGLIGCFLNTLVLRTDLSGAPSFRELVARVRTVTLEAYSNQDVPFEAVLNRLRLDRDLSRSPLFQVLFNLLNLPARDLALPGLDLRVLTPAEVPSKLDMTFYVSEAETRVVFNLVYNADLFDEARMADVLAQLEGLLAQAVERPDEPVDHLSLVTAAARALLPDPAAVLPVPDFPPVARLFFDREREQPEQTALAWSDGAWTYAQLGARAREIARAAIAAGAGPGTVAAVAGSRSPELIAGLLGVFLSGGVLLILDRKLPAARLRVMVEEAKPGCLVYVGEPQPEDTWLWEAGSFPVLTVQPARADGPDIGPEDSFPWAAPDDPAYVFFTSGTTGRPKAVLGRQKGLSHFLTWQRSTFGIGPGDRAAQLTGLSFDVVLRDVFLPLTSGATLVLPDEDDVSPERILVWLRERAISVVHTVPSLASAWLGAAPSGFQTEALRWTFFAGEPLLAQVVTRWRAAFPETSVVNLYGPTETTLAKCFYRVPDPPVQDVQPVGTPLPQTQALILLGGGGGERLCGLGEVGEIVLRTPFRSLGYLNNPEENRRFRPNPFRDDPDDLLYVSGDRGRYRLDGTVEILGRLDEQVKIRGVRVEPAEIRAALGRHPAVWESAVLVREQRPGGLSGDKRLVAYLVLRPGAALDLEALRRHLRQELPEAMVPSTFVTVDALPLTPNGKLDRRALAQIGARSEPEIQAGSDEPRALRTPVEEIVAGVAAEVLGLPQVGPDGNFFQLGGHSLSGAQLVSRLRQALQVELPLRVLFEAPTVAGLAAEIERRRRDGAPERPAISAFRQDRSAPPPLSFAQERFWAERQLESRTVASTLPTLVLLEGPLDVGCLRRAVQEIVDRHEVLRTTFREDLDGLNGPVQAVHAALPVRLPVIDLQEIARPVQRAEIQRLSIADGRSPFDYERGPLFRMTLFRCSEREHAMLFTIHHVAFDGWSRSVLIGELAALYNAFREGRPSPLRPLAAQYQDFARWQRQVLQGETLEREVGFWREHLRGAAPIRLGRDLPRHPTYTAGLEAFTVPDDLERKLETFAAEHCVTLFMTLLAAFKALLHLESGRDDVVVTSLFANRNQLETEGLIGNFFAGLPLRTRLDGERTFRDLLERVRDVTLAAHEHPDIQYEQAMEGSSFLAPGERGGIATFRIMFQLAKLPRAQQVLSDLKLVHVPFDTGRIRQDLTLFFNQTDRLDGRFKYNRDVLDEETVVRLRDRFLRLLETIVADPERPLADLLVESSQPEIPAVLEGTL